MWLEKEVRTFDPHDSANAIKSFPIRPYIPPLVKAWLEEPIILVPKSRQMMISWLFVSLVLHEAQFYPYRLEAIFSKKEEDALELGERAKFVYENQSEWLKEACPLDRKMRDMPRGNLFYDNGSKLRGFAQGKDQVRGYVPTTALIDEAAFQDKLRETYAACIPSCKRIVLVSSANPGFFQRLCEAA